MTTTVSRQPRIAEAQLRSQASPRGIYCGKDDTGTVIVRELSLSLMIVINLSVALLYYLSS